MKNDDSSNSLKDTIIKPAQDGTLIMTTPDSSYRPGIMLEISSLTDVGKTRDHNEDSLLVLKKECEANGKRTEVALLVVADGMGGRARGEVASLLAIETILDSIYPAFSNPGINPEEELRKGIAEAEKKIQSKMLEDQTCKGMGTTVVTALIVEDNLYVGNVGDSRCYFIRNGEISQITKDHSLVQEMVDKGVISEMEAKKHPDKNVITNAVGAAKTLVIDTFEKKIHNDDTILLTSDGLVGELSNWEIKDIVLKSNTPKEACKELVRRANERGGRDNISIIVANVRNSK